MTAFDYDRLQAKLDRQRQQLPRVPDAVQRSTIRPEPVIFLEYRTPTRLRRAKIANAGQSDLTILLAAKRIFNVSKSRFNMVGKVRQTGDQITWKTTDPDGRSALIIARWKN
jgi:hypothetical protein